MSLSRPSYLDANNGAAIDPVRQVGLARADGLHHLQQAGPDQEDQAAGGTGRAGGTVRHRQVPVQAVPVRRREVENVVRGVGGFYVVAARREEGGLLGSKDILLLHQKIIAITFLALLYFPFQWWLNHIDPLLDCCGHIVHPVFSVTYTQLQFRPQHPQTSSSSAGTLTNLYNDGKS